MVTLNSGKNQKSTYSNASCTKLCEQSCRTLMSGRVIFHSFSLIEVYTEDGRISFPYGVINREDNLCI